MGIKSRAGTVASELFKGETQSLAKCSNGPCGQLRNNTPECRSKRKVICFLLHGVSLSGQVIPFVIASFRKGRNILPPPSPWAQKKLISVCFSEPPGAAAWCLVHSTPAPRCLALYCPSAGGGSPSDGISDSSAMSITLNVSLLG